MGEGDRLYGSVTARDIEEALAAQGYAVDRRRIAAEPLKALGSHPVSIRLATSVTATIEVIVAKKSCPPRWARSTSAARPEGNALRRHVMSRDLTSESRYRILEVRPGSSPASAATVRLGGRCASWRPRNHDGLHPGTERTLHVGRKRVPNMDDLGERRSELPSGVAEDRRIGLLDA